MATVPVDLETNKTDQGPIVITNYSLSNENTTFPSMFTVNSSEFYKASQEMSTTVFESSVKDLSSTENYWDSVEESVSHVDGLHNTTFSPDSYLDSLNEDFANSILPAVVFIFVLMLMGLVGNTYVLYVYSKNNCNRTIIRFIQALAVFDLLSCAIAMPGEILDMTRNYTFGNSGWCPTFRTVNLFCTMASGATLIVVAIDRYRRICDPLKSQIKPKTAGFILLGLSIGCMVLSSPSAIVFGSKSIPTPVNYINGSDCSISDNVSDTPLPLAFNGFQLLLFLIGAVALVIIYSLIARTILHQARQRKKRSRQRRLSLKNGGRIPPANNRSDVSSPSSPTHNPKKPIFRYPDTVLDNVLDLSDVLPSMKGPLNTLDDGDAKTERYSNEVEDSSKNVKQVVTDSTRRSKIRKGPFTFPRSISVTSSTSGIDADIPSNATLSPPDTPIDQQRIELVSLLKHKSSSNARLIYQLKRHSADKINGHHEQIKECSDSIPANGNTCIDQNANKQTIDNVNMMLGQVSNEKADDILKTEVESRLADNETVIAEVENEEESKNRTRSLDRFDKNAIVSYKQKEEVQAKEESENIHHNMKGHRISLLLPPPKRKVVFRSSSLGHEDTKNYQRPHDYSKASKSLDLDSETPVTPLRRRRLSSFRGLKDLRRLTLSEYQGTVRTTSMLFLITLIYILSFLPHLILMTFKAIGDENNTWLVARNIILRSYFINSVANPIIYSFCSRNFFSQCRNPSGHNGTLTR